MASQNTPSASQDTQVATQTQQSGLPWSQLESQPIKQIWGRLYAKTLSIATLGTKQALPVLSQSVTDSFGTLNDSVRENTFGAAIGGAFSNSFHRFTFRSLRRGVQCWSGGGE